MRASLVVCALLIGHATAYLGSYYGCNPPCQNGGQCDAGQCDCPDAYYGWRCEHGGFAQPSVTQPTANPPNSNVYWGSCYTYPCQHGGTCDEGECDCLDIFYGPQCQFRRGGYPGMHPTSHPTEFVPAAPSEPGPYPILIDPWPMNPTPAPPMPPVGCYPSCLNGGVCRRGVCDCPPRYTGSRCAKLRRRIKTKRKVKRGRSG